MAQHIAFFGLGHMGSHMATNLVKAGCSVRVYDPVPAAMEQATTRGCIAAASPTEAVADAEFVITMLPNGKIVEALLIDEQGLLDHVPSTALVIDCSTVAAHNSRRLWSAASERGLRFIDAPVSGGVGAAQAGTLAFMCGGEADDVEAGRAVLQHMGAHVFHAGPPGAGSVAKICNNMLLAVHMIGTAEALQLGVANGLDPKVLSDIMLKSSGANWSLEKYNPYPGVMPNVPASNGYQGGFKVNLMLKDLGLALETASVSQSPIPMGNLATSLYELHRSSNGGDQDFSSILTLLQGARSD